MTHTSATLNQNTAQVPFNLLCNLQVCQGNFEHPQYVFLKQHLSHNPGISEPSACLLCDDNVGNIKAAKTFGWQTVLVGKTDRYGNAVASSFADVHVGSLHELPTILPQLFMSTGPGLGSNSVPVPIQSQLQPQPKRPLKSAL